MELKTIIFIGRSGCGKGTQADLVSKYISKNDSRDIFHLEAGDQFRKFINEKSYSSVLAKKINDDGGLQPEFLSIWAWSAELISKLKDNQHLMIDGTPRRVGEAKILESAMKFFDRPRVDIVYLNVSKKWASEKLRSRGRADDADESDIESKMNWFDKEVKPVLKFYKKDSSYIFHEINGEQTIDEVSKDIIDSLGL